VAAAYGWGELDLGYGFHATAQGIRYTISEPVRRQVLGRLLELSHARYAAQVAAGLHENLSFEPERPRAKRRVVNGALVRLQ
jgi:hypothetical protein